MPIYDFKCLNEKCKDYDNTFEAILKLSDKTLPECPTCSKDMVEKLLTAGYFRFKGGSPTDSRY